LDAPPAAPEMGRRRGQLAAAAPVAAARVLPPGFGEYPPGDPRYVGLTDAEQSGVRPELLAAPVTGPVHGEVVQRRPPTAFMVDVEREDPDSPDFVEIEREAMLILLSAIATKEGPAEGKGDAGGPGTATGVTSQVAHGGAKDACGPEKAAGEPAEGPKKGAGVVGGLGKAAGEPAGDPERGEDGAGGPAEGVSEPPQVTVPTSGTKDAGGPVKAAGGLEQPSKKDGKEGNGKEAGGDGEDPSQEKQSAAESGKAGTGSGEASAGGGGGDGGEGTGDGKGDDEGGDGGDAEMEVDVEHATVELNEKGECKRDPEFWAPPLKLPTGGSVYLERFKKNIEAGSSEGRSPTADENIEPPSSSHHAKSVAGSTLRAGPKCIDVPYVHFHSKIL
jgi:hypothetical protein